jgi:hypothetical protein
MKRVAGGGRRRTSKKQLAGFWSNSDFEFLQKISAKNGAATAACKKREVKSFP